MLNSRPEVTVLVGRSETENTADALVHVAVKIIGPAANLEDRHPLKIVFAVDRSGSMGDSASEDDRTSKMTRVKQIMHRLFPMFTNRDIVGFLAYADIVTAISSACAMTSENKQRLERTVDSLNPFGNTNIGEALRVACAAARALSSGCNDPVYVLFLTDGNPTDGITKTSTLVDLLKQPWANKVRLLCAGVGYDYNPDLLRALAEESGGHFCHIQSEGQFANAMGDLLGAAASIQHTSINVRVTPASGFAITQNFSSRPCEIEGNHLNIQLPDVYAESKNAVGFELGTNVRDSLPSCPVSVCTVRISGVEVATGESWEVAEEVKVSIKASGTATAAYNSKAYDVLLRIVAQTAAKQALVYAESLSFNLAVGRVDQAIRFVEFCRPFCNVDQALELLNGVRNTVSNPDNFRQQRHDRTATTMWFSGTGSSAPGGASKTQKHITQALKPGLIGDDSDNKS